MFKKVVLTLMLVGLCNGLCFGENSSSTHRGEKFMEKFDLDKDGLVSMDEFKGPDRMFMKIDKDEDGFISKEEIASTRGKWKAGNRGFIKNFDEDGDGKVSKEEFKGSERFFSKIDKNGDGYITGSELAEKQKSFKNRKRDFVKDFDEDGDNKISPDEFPGPEDHFVMLDKNGDGYISFDEAPRRRHRHGNTHGKMGMGSHGDCFVGGE